ncbi:discoidin domain-containing protein [Luteimicrobium sp. NPDC057192]|uniref:discoidin domain-containing protein n=1 Tax=Luteimicrobium sp. NPDC057192 TaxID=3346042 RepID=UPI003639DBF5
MHKDRWKGPVALAATVALAASFGASAVAPADATSAGPTDHGWTLSTTDPTVDYSPTFTANGSLGARIPAAGQGYATSPVESQSRLAGFFADNGDVEVSAQVPAWTTLALSAGGATTGRLPAAPAACVYGSSCEGASAVLTGGTTLVPGGWIEGFADSATRPQIGATATFTVEDVPADGTARLTLRYGSDVDDASVTVQGGDDTAPRKVALPSSGGWATWATVDVDVPVHAGSDTVAVSCSELNSSCRLNLDGIVLTDPGTPTGAAPCVYGRSCEAEDSALSGGTDVATDHTGYTGTGFVEGFARNSLPHPGSTAAFTVENVPAGTSDLQLRYANGRSGTETLTLTVNGSARQVSLPVTGGWDAWGTVTVPVTLSAGSDDVAVACADGDSCKVNLDSVAVVATGTTFLDGGGTVGGYQQSLDLRTGTVTTEYDWNAPDGKRAHVRYDVIADRADPSVGLVRLTLTPRWTGTARVVGQFDATGVGSLVSEVSRGTSGPDAETYEEVEASGTGVTAGLAARLEAPRGATIEEVGQGTASSAGQSASFPVKTGKTYTVTKYVGAVVEEDGVADPLHAARTAAQDAADDGYGAAAAANARAWAEVWTSDIVIKGDPTLQEQVRASEFYLLASIREGSSWSLAPGGLSSNGYNGHTFWDTETWMYPSLLAQHPEIAASANEYRYERLGAAEDNAARFGDTGARFPWESALTGAEATPSCCQTGTYELHVSSDVALAQWQYYLATRDRGWLTTKGWPVIEGVARYWASRAEDNGDGSYSINDVIGPDEYREGVDDNAYTNASAAEVLRIAATAAGLVGGTADPAWASIADGLERSITTDPGTGVIKQDDSYAGQTIKQADTVMLQYPWASKVVTPKTALANLDYYAPRADLGGPSMTDAIHMIDTLDLQVPGRSAAYYTQRSVDAFMRAPFYQFSETRTGGAFTFTTGAGGFLQEFLYGYSGLRWDARSVVLDPSLTMDLDGVTLRGLKWQGRTYDVAIGPKTTTVTLTGGSTMPVTVAGRSYRVSAHAPLTVATNRPDLAVSGDLAQLGRVSATSTDLSYPAVGAVDGSATTSWRATGTGASLTVDLGAAKHVKEVAVTSGSGSTTPYTIDVSRDGRSWHPEGAVDAGAAATSSVAVDPSGPVRYVRYTATGTARASIATLAVSPGDPASLSAPVFSSASQVYGSPSPATVSTVVTGAHGTVTFRSAGRVLGTATTAADGRATLALPALLPVGTYARVTAALPATGSGRAVTSPPSAMTFRVLKAATARASVSGERYRRATSASVTVGVANLR